MPRIKASASEAARKRGKGGAGRGGPRSKSTESFSKMKDVGKNIKAVVGQMKSAVQSSEGKQATKSKELCEKCKKRKRPPPVELAGTSAANSPLHASPLSLPDYDRDGDHLLGYDKPRKYSLSSVDKYERYIGHVQGNASPGTAHAKSKALVQGMAASLQAEHGASSKQQQHTSQQHVSKKPKPNTSPTRNCGIYALSSDVNPNAYNYSDMTFFGNVGYSDSLTSAELPSDIFDQTTLSVEHDDSMSIVHTNKALFIGITNSASRRGTPKTKTKLPWKRKTDSASSKPKSCEKLAKSRSSSNPFQYGKGLSDSNSKLKASTPKDSPSTNSGAEVSIFKSPEPVEPSHSKASRKPTKKASRKNNASNRSKKKEKLEDFNFNSNSNSAIFELLIPVQDERKEEFLKVHSPYALGYGALDSFGMDGENSNASRVQDASNRMACARSEHPELTPQACSPHVLTTSFTHILRHSATSPGVGGADCEAATAAAPPRVDAVNPAPPAHAPNHSTPALTIARHGSSRTSFANALSSWRSSGQPAADDTCPPMAANDQPLTSPAARYTLHRTSSRLSAKLATFKKKRMETLSPLHK